jgi:Flp pilus assembly protein TadG
MKRLFRRCQPDEGSNLIEYAIVLPMLLLVVLGIAEFGFIFHRYEVITNAAREGARMAVLPGYSSVQGETAVIARVNAYVDAGLVPTAANNPTVTIANDTVDVPPLSPVAVKIVTVTYTHQIRFLSAIDNFFGVTFAEVPMTAVSQMRVEGGS